ncbi:protein of unknown function [Bradyrhizobium sp. ORS 285]|nr:protein of unknown function [Bradyrhizobium sp. ORS 285]
MHELQEATRRRRYACKSDADKSDAEPERSGDCRLALRRTTGGTSMRKMLPEFSGGTQASLLKPQRYGYGAAVQRTRGAGAGAAGVDHVPGIAHLQQRAAC